MSRAARRVVVSGVGLAVLLLASDLALAQAKPELPKTLFLPIGKGVKMDFVLIPPGTFTMGSEMPWSKPAHEVTISKPFYLGVYEVTQAQWKALLVDNPSNSRGDNLPVENVSWEDCQTFLAQLNEMFGGVFTFRLPTEAEWEYACRAGSKTIYTFGNDRATFKEYAWYNENSENKTHPVGQKKPNAWGLYDMHGNVSEFCADWYERYYLAAAATDPTGPTTGTVRILRGGSWLDKPWYCRSAGRLCQAPSVRRANTGLRVVCIQGEPR